MAQIDWVPASEGGRSSGVPSAPVYAAICVFDLGDEAAVQPGWPATADLVLSILIQEISRPRPAHSVARIGFLAPHLAEPYIRTGNRIVVMEGRRIVAHATITEILPHKSADI